MAIFTAIIRSIDFQKSDEREQIHFVTQSASLSIDDQQTNQGILKKHTVKFKITPIDDVNQSIVAQIKKSRNFRIIDSHNFITEVGSNEKPPQISVRQDTDGVAGGFRGYYVTIMWNSI